MSAQKTTEEIRQIWEQALEAYRLAARFRKLDGDGVNTSRLSRQLFTAVAIELEDLADELAETPDGNLSFSDQLMYAHMLHDAASSSATGNGGAHAEQRRLNQAAIAYLRDKGEPTTDQNREAWENLTDKIRAGMMEARHITFRPELYLDIVRRMVDRGLKDAPGRALFWIRYLRETMEQPEDARIFASSLPLQVYSDAVQNSYALGQRRRLLEYIEEHELIRVP